MAIGSGCQGFMSEMTCQLTRTRLQLKKRSLKGISLANSKSLEPIQEITNESGVPMSTALDYDGV